MLPYDYRHYRHSETIRELMVRFEVRKEMYVPVFDKHCSLTILEIMLVSHRYIAKGLDHKGTTCKEKT